MGFRCRFRPAFVAVAPAYAVAASLLRRAARPSTGAMPSGGRRRRRAAALQAGPRHAAVPLGAEAVPVDMAGCEAGGATFAVAHATASSADTGRELDACLAGRDTQPSSRAPRSIESPGRPCRVPLRRAAPARLDTQGPTGRSRGRGPRALVRAAATGRSGDLPGDRAGLAVIVRRAGDVLRGIRIP